MATTETVRIVAYRDDIFWIAQCLEHDVCVQADDIETARERMEVALAAEEDLANLPPAPDRFQEMWDASAVFESAGHTDRVDYKMALAA